MITGIPEIAEDANHEEHEAVMEMDIGHCILTKEIMERIVQKLYVDGVEMLAVYRRKTETLDLDQS